MQQKSGKNSALGNWLSGAAIGAIAMYLSDPDRGRRRRAIGKDKMFSIMHRANDAINVASRDLGNRVQGLRAETSRRLGQRNTTVDDNVLMERARSKIGRVVSHPHAIKVRVQGGFAMLSGPVLASERERLVATVKSVPGIWEIDDALQVHESAEGVSALQGEGRLKPEHASMLQSNWPPAWRAVAMVGGSALALYGLNRRSVTGTASAAAGIGLLVRAFTNTPRMSGSGIATGAQAINLHKTIHIDAPPDLVFDVWSKYENFPYFMSNVKEVTDLGDGRSHWVVNGPGGVEIEWNSTLTDAERPNMLAWRSEEDSPVQHSGMVRLEPAGDGTRVSVQMSYSPPAGAVGHAAASLFNGNPKQQLDEDLLRMKSFIESGVSPHDSAKAMQAAAQGVVIQ